MKTTDLIEAIERAAEVADELQQQGAALDQDEIVNVANALVVLAAKASGVKGGRGAPCPHCHGSGRVSP